VAASLASISRERYQTHIFGKDRAMTVEEDINELIAPNSDRLKIGGAHLMHPLIPRLCFLGKENLAARLSFA
jgi:hypothetical protein